MSTIARLEVIPTREGSMADAVANAVEALDEFDVSYETTPTDTVVEADDVSEVFAAAEAAHRAVEDDRVITSLEVDESRTRSQRRQDRVASVERELGRPAKRERERARARKHQQRESVREASQRTESPTEPRRYHSPTQERRPRRSQGQSRTRRAGQSQTESGPDRPESQIESQPDHPESQTESQPDHPESDTDQSVSRYLRPRQPISR